MRIYVIGGAAEGKTTVARGLQSGSLFQMPRSCHGDELLTTHNYGRGWPIVRLTRDWRELDGVEGDVIVDVECAFAGDVSLHNNDVIVEVQGHKIVRSYKAPVALGSW